MMLNLEINDNSEIEMFEDNHWTILWSPTPKLMVCPNLHTFDKISNIHCQFICYIKFINIMPLFIFRHSDFQAQHWALLVSTFTYRPTVRQPDAHLLLNYTIVAGSVV